MNDCILSPVSFSLLLWLAFQMEGFLTLMIWTVMRMVYSRDMRYNQCNRNIQQPKTFAVRTYKRLKEVKLWSHDKQDDYNAGSLNFLCGQQRRVLYTLWLNTQFANAIFWLHLKLVISSTGSICCMKREKFHFQIFASAKSKNKLICKGG